MDLARFPRWRGLHQNEVDLARFLRAVLTSHSPREVRKQAEIAAALSVRLGDVTGEITRGVLRAALAANGSPAAITVLRELEMNTGDLVDQAILNYLRWMNRNLWDDDTEIERIIARRVEKDDLPVIEPWAGD
jgi:hypothetical protein